MRLDPLHGRAGPYAGADGSIVVGRLIDANDPNRGFDAQTGDYVDMIKSGIIDPAKVVRLALQNAASIAGFARDDRSDGGRKAREEDSTRHATGWHGRVRFGPQCGATHWPFHWRS
jgi:hypothetical protein